MLQPLCALSTYAYFQLKKYLAHGPQVMTEDSSGMLRPGSRVCNSMRKITEIVTDYGGMANGCQLTEVWPGGQKTLNEG